MILSARILAGSSAASPSVRAVRDSPSDGLPPLPESVRVVAVPGIAYAVETASGLVLDKETTLRTDVTNVRTDLFRVRTTDGREASWSFTGSTLQARAGHTVSVVSRRIAADGSPDAILVYNHSTDQLEPLAGLAAAHAPRFLVPLVVATLVGSLGFAAAIWVLLQIGPDPIQGVIGAVAVGIMGGIGAAIVAAFVMLQTFKGVVRRRDAAFAERYLPEFRRYLQERGRALQSRPG